MSKIQEDFDGYFVMNADRTSDDIAIGHADVLSVQAVMTITDAVGTLKLQMSNDRTNWVDGYFAVNGDTETLTDGYDVDSVDSNLLLSTPVISSWAKLAYTSTSGTGGLTYYVWKGKRS